MFVFILFFVCLFVCRQLGLDKIQLSIFSVRMHGPFTTPALALFALSVLLLTTEWNKQLKATATRPRANFYKILFMAHNVLHLNELHLCGNFFFMLVAANGLDTMHAALLQDPNVSVQPAMAIAAFLINSSLAVFIAAPARFFLSMPPEVCGLNPAIVIKVKFFLHDFSHSVGSSTIVCTMFGFMLAQSLSAWIGGWTGQRIWFGVAAACLVKCVSDVSKRWRAVSVVLDWRRFTAFS